jgi:hypothetical protein
MYKFGQNTFSKGMNKDFDERVIQNNTYRDSVNFTLTNEGEFFSLTKMNSSGDPVFIDLSSFLNTDVTDVKLLGDIECNMPNEDSAVVLYLYINKSNSVILTVNLDKKISYLTAEGDWINHGEVVFVDTVLDRDNGIDYVYSVDGVNPPRKISVEEGDRRYTNQYQIVNIKLAAMSPIEDVSEAFEAGTLLGGSYQIGYKLFNTDTGRESVASVFTNPINIAGRDYKGGNIDDVYGLLPNESSSSAIKFKINLFGTDADDLDRIMVFNSIKLLIIAHNDGNKVNNDVVYELAPNKQLFIDSFQLKDAFYRGDEPFTTIPLSEIAVDDIAIKTARTITLKEGNIFYGNIINRSLKVKADEGIPLNTTSTTKDIGTSSNRIEYDGKYTTLSNAEGGYKNASNTCYYKSERRGEVIRYGIVYGDEWGNWSQPKPFDFSGDSAFTVQSTNTIAGESYSYDTGRLVIVSTTSIPISIGSFVGVYLVNPDGSETMIPSLILEKVNSNEVLVDFDAELYQASTISTNLAILGNSRKSNSFSSDWGFPSRKDPYFTLLNSSTSISALGLKIGSISKHPEWAKRYMIVRVGREKNILTQAISMPSQAIMPSLNTGEDVPVGDGANFDGAFTVKVMSKGGLTNIWRTITGNNRADESAANAPNGDADSDARRIIPIVKLLSPDYMASSADGTIYDDTWVNTGDRLDLVDAISVFGTKLTAFNSQYDDGDNQGDQQGFIFSADTASNYYYQRSQESSNIAGIRRVSFNVPIKTANAQIISTLNIKGTYPMVTAQAPLLLPNSPVPKSANLKVIYTLGDLYGVSQQNGGLLESSSEKKGVYCEVDGGLGDLTYYAATVDVTPSGVNPFKYARNLLDFGRLENQPRYNVEAENSDDANVLNQYIYGQFGNFNSGSTDSGTAWNDVIRERDSSRGVLSVVNVLKGLDDFRYGDLDREHNYFPTGTYGRIYSPTTPLSNIEVFGGDTFISKCYFKTTSSALGIFSKEGVIPSDGTNVTRGYTDWHEVVGCYLESDVNFDLQADRYSYPCTREQVGLDFRYDYSYPYNFSYSVKNLSKVFRNFQQNTDENTDYGSRIVYTDKHIINSLDDNFARIRIGSKYDMDASFGDIEKLSRLSNDVYCLQRNGFSYIPIGKRTIEDGNGGEMVINTTDTITTPQYYLTKNGCQDIATVKESKASLLWVDRERREVFMFQGKGSQPSKISDIGMHSYFNENLNDVAGELWSSYDFDKEEYHIQIGAFSAVFSEKIGVWTSRLFTGIENRLFGGSDGLNVIGTKNNGVGLERMYVGSDYGSILDDYLSCEIELISNEDIDASKVFDALRIDNTYQIAGGRMRVNTNNNTLLDTTYHSFPVKQIREGGYEVYTIRDNTSGQRMRGKAMIINLRDDDTTNHLSVVSVITKYRISNERFVKQYNRK